MLLLAMQIILGKAEDDMGLDFELILSDMESQPELSGSELIDMSVLDD